MKVTATFQITGWDPVSSDAPDAGPELSRVVIRKVFRGDLEGESSGEGLFCGMNAPEDGAGYVAIERIQGRLEGRLGSFVIQHGGLMGLGLAPQTFGHVVPGSGTGGLAGLRGDVEIARTGDGEHTLTMDYDFDADTSA